MRNSRESIYNALLNLCRTVLPQDAIQTFSRVYRPLSSYAAAQLGAVCLDEVKESANAANWGVRSLYKLHVDMWIYLAPLALSQIPGQEQIIPMTAINNILDVIEDSPLSNPPTSGLPTQSLGGLVERLYIEGDILKAATVGDSNAIYSVARVPLVIFTT